MKKLLVFFVSVFIGFGNAFSQKVYIVKNNQPNAAILKPSNCTIEQETAINEFVQTVQRATSAKIEVFPEDREIETSKIPIKIVLGPSEKTAEILGTNPALLPEQYMIIPKGNYIVILAQDIIRQEYVLSSRVNAWAFAHIMEHYMQVKWLWPGDLGTVVPKLKSITIPNEPIVFQPILQKRRLYYQSQNNDLMQWAAHHQVAGERLYYRFSHSFRAAQSNGNWFQEFKDTKPYLLAQNPNGKPELYGQADFFKICTSHKESVNEVVKRWQKAGSPNYWDITPNDGNGFCTCDSCMKTDSLYGDYQYTKKEVWEGQDHVNLTGRHVHFWNNVVGKMRETNPNATVGVFLYSRYRDAPKRIKVNPGVWGEIVHGYDFSYWKAWTEAGVEKIGLRPNWWHMGANGPHLPLTQAGNYIELARKNNMMHLFMDMLTEYWATQGPYYYMVARLQHRYDLSKDQIINEYCDTYGKAGPLVRQYLQYWENYMEQVDYNIPAGGKLNQNPNGIYEKESNRVFGEVLHPLQGHYVTMPYIYTDSVLAQSDKILIKALKKVKTNSPEYRRIEFLRDGLLHVKTLRQFFYIETTDYNAKKEYFVKVEALHKELTQKYGYWGSHEKLMLGLWKLLDGKKGNVNDM
jgi:hypothetical protein